MDVDTPKPLTAGDINKYFTCPACKGYLRDPHVLVCCVSTFCRDCLVRALRQPASLCPNPSCGKYMGVKLSQSSRPDNQLQAIMLKLFPQVFEEERQREAAYYKKRVELGVDKQGGSGSSSSGGRLIIPPSMSRESSASSSSSSSISRPLGGDANGALAQEMYVLCCPMEGIPENRRLPPLKFPYLKLKRRTQMPELRRILVSALGVGSDLDPESVEITCKGEIVRGGHHLFFVERTKWREEKPPLALHYRRKAQMSL